MQSLSWLGTSTLDHPQQSASRAWVGSDLFGPRSDRPGRQDRRLGLFPAAAHRKVRRTNTVSGQVAEEPLDDPVLERVIGDDRQSRAFLQPLDALSQALFQGGQLVVDGDAQRLEDARDRLETVAARGDGRFDDLAQPSRRDDGFPLALTHNRARDAAGMSLLPEIPQDPSEDINIGARQPVPCRLPSGPHPHIQWSVLPVTEAARQIVDLSAGDAEVEECAGEPRTWLREQRHLVEIGEVEEVELRPVAVPGEPLASMLDGRGIL